jgi:hypothetical protein
MRFELMCCCCAIALAVTVGMDRVFHHLILGYYSYDVKALYNPGIPRIFVKKISGIQRSYFALWIVLEFSNANSDIDGLFKKVFAGDGVFPTPLSC